MPRRSERAGSGRLGLRFVATSLIVFLAIGLILRMAVGAQLRDDHRDAAEFHALFVTDNLLRDAFAFFDPRKPISVDQSLELQSLVRSIVQGNVKRLKVWRTDGTIVYSDEPRLIGNRFAGEQEELLGILKHGPESGITDLNDKENAFERPLAKTMFSTYSVLRTVGPGGALIAELYQDYAPTAAATARSQRTLDYVLGAALIALYALMLPIARRTSRALRRSNEALRRTIDAVGESEEKYRGVAETASDAIVTVDANDNVTYVNPAAETIFGYRNRDLVGRPVTSLIPRWEKAARLYEPLHASVPERIARKSTIELEGVRANQTRFPIELSVAGWNGTEGRVLTAIARDVTERKLVEERLRAALEREQEAAAQLRALDDMKNSILTAVSHELRTPLAAVLGFATTLEQHGESLPANVRQESIKRIAQKSRKLQRLLGDLLDVDRLARGILAPNRQKTDVRALLERVVAEHDTAARHIVLASPCVTAWIDAPKVERCVENLVINSLKHAPDATEVHVRCEERDEGFVIEVEDDGPGVPEEIREAIFQPFFQGPSASPHAPGTGIGLSLVARFAELHGGKAWVDEGARGGARFCLYIPSIKPAPPKSAGSATESRAERAS